MGLADVAAQIAEGFAQQVKVDTWGHMAPEKNMTYPIVMTAAVGYFSDDMSNPVLLSCGPEGGPWYGPWFYDAVRHFLSEKIGREANSGRIFRFQGHWRNYKFVGKFKEFHLASKQAGEREA